MPKYLLILSLLLCLATGCERGTEDDVTEQMPVAFTACTDGEEATRAGVITNGNLASMGVFASYTGQGNWSASSSKPDFMYNQPVNKSGGSWTYSPVKYWPNTVGDKISFFAYAPHTDKVSGLVFSSYGNNTPGYPSFRYEPPVDATKQTDLLFAAPLMNKTKGSNLAFTMGHVLTHVLFKVKSTSAITVTRVQVNSGAHLGYIKFNPGGYSWTSFSSDQNFYRTPTVSVAANTLTDVGDFFLLPRNAASVSLTFSEGGTSQTETVALPPSPAWAVNKTIAYTLNIENKTKVTLSVKSWDSGTVSGTMGEEASGTYPFMLNGIIYESASEYYYVGAYKTDYSSAEGSGWYTWDEAMNICKLNYSNGPYGAKQWRLPSRREMALVHQFNLPAVAYRSTYWTYEQSGINAYAYSGGKEVSLERTAGNTARLFCVRDIGDIQVYPTTRYDNGFTVVYRTSDNVYMETLDMSFGGNYAAAVNHCNGLTAGGYTDWRLPTIDEYRGMYDFGITWSTCWSSNSGGSGAHMVFVESGSTYSKNDAENARTYCVRDY